MIRIEFTQFVGAGDNLLSEPSGITQLPQEDGSFIVVNDTNAQKALFIVNADNDGRLHSRKLDFPDSPELDDLEGVAVSGDWIYAISSHSVPDSTDDSPARRIARFQLNGNQVCRLQDARGADRLKKRVEEALSAKHPQLEDEDFADEEFNIEGFANQDDDFLIGLRSPLVDDQAMVVRTYGLQRAYGNEPEKYGVFANSVPLDLGKGGIRALSHIPDLGGYLIVSGKTVSGQEEFDCEMSPSPSVAKFLLWFWDGKDRCQQVACFDMEQDGVKIQPEGISSATLEGRKTVCIVSDDGDEDNQIPGRYSILSQAQYQELKGLIQ